MNRVARLGEALKIGVERFGKDIESQLEIVPSNQIKQESERLEAFKKIEKTTERPEIDDKKIRNLLIYGDLKEDCLQYAAIEPYNYSYCLYRDVLDKAEKIIDNGGRNIVITGNVGNGKTIFIKSLAYRLNSRGYNVYMLEDICNGNPERELEQICRVSDRNTVIIIESYNSHKELFSLFKAFRGDVQLVVTERSSLNDIHIDWLRETIEEDLSIINLDHLKENEIENLIVYLNSIDVWGELAANKDWQKRNFLTKNCNSELRSVLIHLLETKPILEHLRELVGSVENNGSFYKSLIMVLLASYAGFRTDIYELAGAIDQDLMCNTSFRRNDTIKEFIDFSTGRSKATSPILAEVILKKLIDPKRLMNTMVDIFKNLDKYSYNNRGALIKLMTFSTLHTILASHLGNKADKEISDFYGKIRDCKICKKNPHYWLQYAIAMLEIRDFPSASIYFNNAYSYTTERKWFSHIQIDNHFARYLLENAIANKDGHFFDSFLEAHRLLLNPNFMKDTKYYPFKVAKLYPVFFEKYNQNMSIEQIQLFKDNVLEMLAQLNKYRKSVGEKNVRRDVLDAEKGLNLILQEKRTFKK